MITSRMPAGDAQSSLDAGGLYIPRFFLQARQQERNDESAR